MRRIDTKAADRPPGLVCVLLRQLAQDSSEAVGVVSGHAERLPDASVLVTVRQPRYMDEGILDLCVRVANNFSMRRSMCETHRRHQHA